MYNDPTAFRAGKDTEWWLDATILVTLKVEAPPWRCPRNAFAHGPHDPGIVP